MELKFLKRLFYGVHVIYFDEENELNMYYDNISKIIKSVDDYPTVVKELDHKCRVYTINIVCSRKAWDSLTKKYLICQIGSGGMNYILKEV